MNLTNAVTANFWYQNKQNKGNNRTNRVCSANNNKKNYDKEEIQTIEVKQYMKRRFPYPDWEIWSFLRKLRKRYVNKLKLECRHNNRVQNWSAIRITSNFQ
jgi:hypothetical protein